MMMGASFVMASQIVVADFMTKLKHLGNRPKSNEKTAGYIFIGLEHFRITNVYLYVSLKADPISFFL
jgi:hypothetical protein